MRTLIPVVLFLSLASCTPQAGAKAYLVRDVACKGVRILYGLCEASEQMKPTPDADGGAE